MKPPEAWRRNVATLLLASCTLPTCGDDNPTRAAGDTCDGCIMTLEHVGEFGSDSDPGSSDLIAPAVAHDSAGNWYVAASSGSEILVYDTSGRYNRSIGRRGKGPGELEGVQFVSVVGDSLHVFSNRRHTVFELDGKVSRVFTLPAFTRKVLFSQQGTYVFQGKLLNASGFGRPLHFVQHDGTTISFGRSDTAAILRREMDPVTAVQSLDSFWVAQPFRYRLELWTRSNTMARAIERHPEWFEWPVERPEAYLVDMWIDTARAMIWTSIAHTHAATRTSPVVMSVVEAIDLRTGRVIAHDSLLVPPLRFTNDGYLYAVHETSSGNIAVSAWRPRLSATGSEGRK